MLDIAYARVSTDEQAKDGKTSLIEQESQCKERLHRLGYDNIKVFLEDFSGYEYNRPELNKIKELITAGKVRSLCALRVDRLSRQAGHLDQLREAYFIPYDIEVHTCDALGHWQWTPDSIFMQNTLVNFSQFWGKLAVQILRDGKIGKVKNGSTLAFGHAPYGYCEVMDKERNYFEIVEDEAAIVRELYHPYVSEGLSLAAIARIMNEREVPTYTDLRGNHFRRSKDEAHVKSEWYGSTVRQILKNPVYKGQWYYGKTKMTRNGKIKDVATNLNVEVPAIVSEDIWNKAQERLSHNKKHKAGRRTKYEILMARRLTCACGLKMAATVKQQGRYKYLRCPGSLSRGEVQRDECPKPFLKSELVDGIAWNWLYKLLSDENELKNKLDNYIEEQERITKPLRERIAIISRVLDKKDKEHDTLTNNYIGLPELARAKILAQIEELEESMKELKAEQAELKEQSEIDETLLGWLEYLKDKELDVDDLGAMKLKQLFGLPQLGFYPIEEALTFEAKRRQIEKFDVQGEIVVQDSKFYIRLTCKLGLEALLELCEGSEAITRNSLNENLPELCEGSRAITQNKQHYFILSDLLLLDFSQLPQFVGVQQ